MSLIYKEVIMGQSKRDFRFIIVFGFVWICFGVFGFFETPERKLLITSQFAAGIIHFIYALIVWHRSKTN